MAKDPARPAGLAVLIDAENTSPRAIAGILVEIGKIGQPNLRRIYGDFSGSRLKGWASACAAHGIDARQSFAHTAGKNASDIALVIDAMDLLHSGQLDAFCLVSSDSDFTRLASRIREQGVDVYGFGERKAPESFRKACKRFVYTEDLDPALSVAPRAAAGAAGAQMAGPSEKLPITSSIAHIRRALNQMNDADGWFFLGELGMRLAALIPEFDPRRYGCSKLLTLVERTGVFDIRCDEHLVYIRPREQPVALIATPVTIP